MRATSPKNGGFGLFPSVLPPGWLPPDGVAIYAMTSEQPSAPALRATKNSAPAAFAGAESDVLRVGDTVRVKGNFNKIPFASKGVSFYSTVTLLARLRGWSTSFPR